MKTDTLIVLIFALVVGVPVIIYFVCSIWYISKHPDEFIEENYPEIASTQRLVNKLTKGK